MYVFVYVCMCMSVCVYVRSLWCVCAPRYLGVTGNLASAYHALGDPGRAKSMLQRALVIQQDLLGPHHLDVANTLCNLARCSWDAGKLVVAKDLYTQALAIYDTQPGGRTHPRVYVVLTSLANLAGLVGANQASENLAERAKGAVKAAISQPCAACQKVSDRHNVCSRCHAVWYCDAVCQTKHWKSHKRHCQVPLSFAESVCAHGHGMRPCANGCVRSLTPSRASLPLVQTCHFVFFFSSSRTGIAGSKRR